MARRPSDHPANCGPIRKHDVGLDARAHHLFDALGGGNTSVGARRAARMLISHMESAGQLPRDVLQWMEAHEPERAADYYQRHPEQRATPYVLPPLAAAPTWRDNASALRALRHEIETQHLDP